MKQSVVTWTAALPMKWTLENGEPLGDESSSLTTQGRAEFPPHLVTMASMAKVPKHTMYLLCSELKVCHAAKTESLLYLTSMRHLSAFLGLMSLTAI